MTLTQSTVSDGVGYADRLPFAWTQGEIPEGLALDRMNEAALRVFDALSAVEEVVREPTDDPAYLVQEIGRLERKIDLLISLMGTVIGGGEKIPDARAVTVHATGIEWHDEDDPPPVGQTGTVLVYPHPATPLALRLPARVVLSTRQEDRFWIGAEFVELEPNVRDALHRHVFRHHRRQVARAKDGD